MARNTKKSHWLRNIRRSFPGIYSASSRVIAGAIDCEKTMLLANLLRKEHILNFRDFYIYFPTIQQDAYTNLKQHFEAHERALETE